MRLIFEGKLNRLFAQYKSLETRYNHLQDQTKALEKSNKEKTSLIKSLQDELKNVKSKNRDLNLLVK